MKLIQNEKWILLGASRGLGGAFLKLTDTQPIERLAVSRKIENFSGQKVQTCRADFSVREKWPELLEQLKNFGPTRIFYFAGGGPFGRFQDKNWKDHEWAFRLNFEFPAFLLHQFLMVQELKQLVFIGSHIAESSPDPMAASYASAKHALKGLITTVQREQREAKSQLDLRLFSPGYMDTQLLPANAWPRQQAELVRPTAEISKVLLEWIQNSDDANGHLALPNQIKLK